MNFRVFPILLIGVALFVSSSEAVQGDATWYNIDGLTACGTQPGNHEMVAAIGFGYWTTPNPNNDPNCNKYATVRNLRNGQQIRVRIQDKCASCGSNNIDLSRGAFQALGEHLDVGRFRVEWNFS